MGMINISLSEALKRFVDKQAAAYGCDTPNEYIHQLIRKDRERDFFEALDRRNPLSGKLGTFLERCEQRGLEIEGIPSSTNESLSLECRASRDLSPLKVARIWTDGTVSIRDLFSDEVIGNDAVCRIARGYVEGLAEAISIDGARRYESREQKDGCFTVKRQNGNSDPDLCRMLQFESEWIDCMLDMICLIKAV